MTAPPRSFPVAPPPTAAELEGLCGRPEAFRVVVHWLFRDTRSLSVVFASGALAFEDRSGSCWWIWPWDPNDPDPWARCPDAQLRERVLELDGGTLHIALAREPEDASELQQSLRRRVSRCVDEGRSMKVVFHGPRELAARYDDQLRSQWWRWLVLPRAQAQLWRERTSFDAAVVEGLDRRHDDPAVWSVVADALVAAGDPRGEAVNLELRSRAAGSTLPAVLSARSEELRALIGVSLRPLCDAPREGVPIDGHFGGPYWARRVWISWCGPFISRVLVDGSPELCAWLCRQPEGLYLSPARARTCSEDLSGADLSRWSFRAAPLTAGSFVDADLRGVEFGDFTASALHFDGADLRGATFREVPRDVPLSFTNATLDLELTALLGERALGRSGSSS